MRSDTPLTDGETWKVEYTSGLHEVVDADLARTLERENNQLRSALELANRMYQGPCQATIDAALNLPAVKALKEQPR